MKPEMDRILWAVDPFMAESGLQKTALAAIEKMVAGNPDMVVQPVYVWGTAPLEGLIEPSVYEQERWRKDGQKRIDRVIGAKRVNLKPLEIVAKPFGTVKEQVQELVHYAKISGADLIVLSTHARKGPARWLLGSFAETLAFMSDVPLLIARPDWQHQASSKNVFFLTDFSKESVMAFQNILNEAKRKNWGITIFHHVKYPLYPGADFDFALMNAYDSAYEEEVKARKIDAEGMADLARERGVRVSVYIDTSRVGSPADLALKAMKKKTYLFTTLASRSAGKTKLLFLGSTTRQLIRNSPIPVWVIYPPRSEEAESTYTAVA